MLAICKTIFFPLSFVSESHKTQILWMVQATSWFLHWVMTSRKKRTEVSSLPRGFPWSLFVTVKCPFMCSAKSFHSAGCRQWLLQLQTQMGWAKFFTCLKFDIPEAQERLHHLYRSKHHKRTEGQSSTRTECLDLPTHNGFEDTNHIMLV